MRGLGVFDAPASVLLCERRQPDRVCADPFFHIAGGHAHLRGKEIGAEEELDGVLDDLRERVVAQLRAGLRVRIR